MTLNDRHAILKENTAIAANISCWRKNYEGALRSETSRILQLTGAVLLFLYNLVSVQEVPVLFWGSIVSLYVMITTILMKIYEN